MRLAERFQSAPPARGPGGVAPCRSSRLRRVLQATTKVHRHVGAARTLGLLLLVLLVLLRIWDPSPLQLLRVKTFDYFQVLKPRVPAVRSVIIVDIDDASLEAEGQWPWSRLLIADLVERIGKLGAVAIGFDILFPEPDRLSPARFAADLRGVDTEVLDALRAMPNNDEVLAGAIGTYRTVLGQSGVDLDDREVARMPIKPAAVVTLGPDPRPFLVRLPGIVTNIRELEAAAAGRGLVTVVAEIDGLVRRVPAVMQIGDAIMPALSVELLRVALGTKSIAIRSDKAGIRSLVLGRASIPTDEAGQIWLHFARHDPHRYIPAKEVLRGQLPADAFAGKLVLIGTSAVGLFDLKATPLDPAIPGVEIHAQLIESILESTLLRRPNYALGAEIALTAAIGLAMIALLPRFGARLVFVMGYAIACVVIVLSWNLYAQRRLLLDAGFPLVASFALFGFLVFVNYLREENKRATIRRAFGRYISGELVDELTRHPEQLVLGGETRELTLLFCDVRKFSAIAELYRDDPQGLTTLMNRFLTPLSEAILERSGTIDKYMGDAIMAFWNAPSRMADHAGRACDAALAMLERLTELNATLAAEAAAAGRPHVPIRIGIGLNTGPCVVGNLGSNLRFDYSALGDAVNLASRIEGLTKQYGVTVLIGERTAELASQHALAEIDLIRVVGKQVPERIYALLGDESAKHRSGFSDFLAQHRRALDSYRNRDWPDALEALEAAERIAPPGLQLSEPYALYRRRIREFEREPPPVEWMGVAEATEK